MSTATATVAEQRRISLRVQVATLLTILLLFTGTLLGWLAYRNATTLLWSASERLSGQIASTLEASLLATYGPVATAVNLLSRSAITRTRDFDARRKTLPLLAESLANNPQLDAVYAAFDDGDFLLVRPVRSDEQRERLQAPADAVLMTVQTTLNARGVRGGERVFLDANLIEVARERVTDHPFKPRTRTWFLQAQDRDARVMSEPYEFSSSRGVGVTMSRRFELGGGVVAADVTLAQLSRTLAELELSPSARLMLVDHERRILASSKHGPSASPHDETTDGLEVLGEQSGDRVLAELGKQLTPGVSALSFDLDGRRWTARLSTLATRSENPWTLVTLAPDDELLKQATAQVQRSVLITALLVVALQPLGWLTAGFIARPLKALAEETRRIGRFHLQHAIGTRTHISEIYDLATSMNDMRATLRRFLSLVGSLSREQDYSLLLDRVLEETMLACDAQAGAIYLLNDDDSALEPVAARAMQRGQAIEFAPLTVPLDQTEKADELSTALRADDATVFRAEYSSGQQGQIMPRFFEALKADALRFIVLPLHDRKGRSMGVMSLAYPDISDAGEQQRIGFVMALSGFSALSIESQRLLKMEKELLEAFIRLIAGAIDAKSPYTGGHCQRVPELTLMLTQAAHDSDEPAFADFNLDDEDWEALHIASWLHDCGKVTTPEYVVDKSTKLETLYDRIHEIRMRFEVLKRDAEIRYWRGRAESTQPISQAELKAELRTLDEEFAFVAECNQGGEFMAPERVERLHTIAARTWQRTLDDRLGVSWDELERKQRTPAQPLPVSEPLLADRDEHLIHRDVTDTNESLAARGFKVDVPKHAYNHGELYNLSIARGTLNDEERFKINDHIVQTIIMLEELPFPRHMRDVPRIAGGHHEKMDGSGYPKRLSRDDMPLTARIMAIADIFEALTAGDRPYKKPKTLSEAIRIMGFMRKDAHIDPALFDLFLRSGVYLDYARKFLEPYQIDDVDITA